MSLLPEGDPELNLSLALITPAEGFYSALSERDAPVSPARAYLLSLNSRGSRPTIASFVDTVPACFAPSPWN